jgi:hypothetical protein
MGTLQSIRPALEGYSTDKRERLEEEEGFVEVRG